MGIDSVRPGKSFNQIYSAIFRKFQRLFQLDQKLVNCLRPGLDPGYI